VKRNKILARRKTCCRVCLPRKLFLMINHAPWIFSFVCECVYGLVFFPVVLDMYWWKVALLRSIPPKHTPKHSPEAYPEANPQNEEHF
jgi:hypothetical protein